KDLAQSQLQKLDTKRIHIRTGSRVERIEEGRLTVHGHQEIRFKYLVGADGSMSIVRRYLKLRQEYVLFALQHLICAKLYDHLGEIKKNQYHYNKRFFLWWYGWIFPHKGYSSVGCGCGRGFLSPKTLKENFSTWLSEMGIGVQAKSPMGFPINCDYRGHEFGNTYLVGDAAGLASYATGEGIHQAIVSGEETAKMIIDPNHKSRKMEGLLSEKKTEDDAFMQIMI
ncbi:MAG: hypothetical protein SV775_17180, partial [Thermodesulfobacteriota bacterium]|nr:hypothetical protein [Thermodesulfobacteriota bacterium]